MLLLLFDCEHKHLTLSLSFSRSLTHSLILARKIFQFFSSWVDLLLDIERCRIRKNRRRFLSNVYLLWLYKPWLLLLLLAIYCWHEWESASFYVMWNMRRTQPDTRTHSLTNSFTHSENHYWCCCIVHMNNIETNCPNMRYQSSRVLLRLCHIKRFFLAHAEAHKYSQNYYVHISDKNRILKKASHEMEILTVIGSKFFHKIRLLRFESNRYLEPITGTNFCLH